MEKLKKKYLKNVPQKYAQEYLCDGFQLYVNVQVFHVFNRKDSIAALCVCVFFFFCIFRNFAVRHFLRNTSNNSKSLQKVLVLIKYWARALLQILISNESYLQTLLFINHNNKSISFSLENVRSIRCNN